MSVLLYGLIFLVVFGQVNGQFRRRKLCHKDRDGKWRLILVRRFRYRARRRRGDRKIGESVPGQPGYIFGSRCELVNTKQEEPETKQLDCTICPFGYFDGCNQCSCDEDNNGIAACTEKACLVQREPTCQCFQEPKQCRDGSYVKPDPDNRCRYPDCPKVDEVNCEICPYGYFDGCNQCVCNRASGQAGCTRKFCPLDAYKKPYCLCETNQKRLCRDGSYVEPDPTNACKYPPCPEPPAINCKTCPYDYNDGCNDCSCDVNDSTRGVCTTRRCFWEGIPSCTCPNDKRRCANGKTVGRNPNNDCKFYPCPLDCRSCPFGFFDGCNSCGCDGPNDIPICTLRSCRIDELTDPVCNKCNQDTKRCNDGSRVGRDPENRCNFYPCPPDDKCCDPKEQPGRFDNPICREGSACCPDGKWSCSIGDAKRFPCGENGEKLLVRGEDKFGTVCKDNSVGCTQDVRECPDGSFVGRDSENQCAFFPCCCDPDTEPGKTGNVFCTDGYVCCPDGQWSCSIGDGKTFPCGENDDALILGKDIFGSKCGGDQKSCSQDDKVCADGSVVGRDPKNNCEFFPCQQQCCERASFPTQCFEGVQCCPNGEWSCSFGDGKTYFCIGRRFVVGEDIFGEQCPEEPCDDDTKRCPDGSYVSRDRKNTCQFFPCPSTKCCDPATEPGRNGNPFCTEGHICCPNGQWSCSIGDGKTFPCNGQDVVLGQDTILGERCSDPIACTTDAKRCPDGSSVGRDPKNNCEFFPCPDPIACTADVKVCADGSIVGRDPKNDCAFIPCPDSVACTEDAKVCPDGSSVSRDPNNDCEFFPCPPAECCDPATEPGTNGLPICSDGYRCCPDGKWSCGIGNGAFPCGGRQIRSGFGDRCSQKTTCRMEYKLCRGGHIVGRDPNNRCEYYPCP